MSNLQPYKDNERRVQPYGGNRDRWARREVDEFKMDMGNGVKFEKKIIIDEMIKGNVIVREEEQFKMKMGNGQEFKRKHFVAERH